MMNQGSTAMQCPPTPAPGVRMFTRGVAIGECDQLPDIDTEAFRNHRKFVGEGDVRVAERVLTELRELSCSCRGPDADPAHERLIERLSHLRGLFIDPTDNAVVLHQLNQYSARQYPLRAVRRPEGQSPAFVHEVRALLHNPTHDRFCGTRRYCGL